MNGFYGKNIQIIKQYYYTKEKIENNESNLVDMILYNNQYIYQYQKYKAGRIFNPIVANEITANTRCQLFNTVKKEMNKIIGFQTDSIISDKKLNINTGNKLGQWEYEKQDKPLVILGSGIYQVMDNENPKRKLRGFEKNFNLYNILKSNPHNIDYELLLKRNYKLKKTMKMKFDNNELMTKEDKFNKFNLLDFEPRYLNINFDKKRLWDRDFKNFDDVLNSQIESEPILI